MKTLFDEEYLKSCPGGRASERAPGGSPHPNRTTPCAKNAHTTNAKQRALDLLKLGQDYLSYTFYCNAWHSTRCINTPIIRLLHRFTYCVILKLVLLPPTSHVEINRKPALTLLAHNAFAVEWICEPQIVPAAACPLRHGIGLPGEPLTVFLEETPVLRSSQATLIGKVDIGKDKDRDI